MELMSLWLRVGQALSLFDLGGADGNIVDVQMQVRYSDSDTGVAVDIAMIKNDLKFSVGTYHC